jgi:hypothetical protein
MDAGERSSLRVFVHSILVQDAGMREYDLNPNALLDLCDYYKHDDEEVKVALRMKQTGEE